MFFDIVRHILHSMCERGGIGRRTGLRHNLSAFGETRRVELVKFGEPCKMAIPSEA
jgi:hypothetical protein